MRFYRLPAYWILLGGLLVWCGLIVLGPLLAVRFPSAAALCYRFFSPVCHQDPVRSFFIFGRPLTVCIRCSAIYSAFCTGVLLLPWASQRLRSSTPLLWLCALCPMLIDVFLDTFGLHSSGTVSRLLTGGIFGLLSAQIVAPLFIEALYEIFPFQQNYRMRHEPQT